MIMLVSNSPRRPTQLLISPTQAKNCQKVAPLIVEKCQFPAQTASINSIDALSIKSRVGFQQRYSAS